MSMPRQAMVLAAGKGTRLRPLTDEVPKSMVRLGSRPVLEYTLAWLREAGVEEVVINLHLHAQTIIDHFGEGNEWGLRIRYSVETTPLGTAGGVKNVAELFKGPFYVWYGDNVSDCDLGRLYAKHREREALATMALHRRENATASGIVELDADDRVVRFVEKPRAAEVFSSWVNAGIYVLEPEALEHFPDGDGVDFGRHVFPRMIAEGAPLYGYRMLHETLLWIDTPEDLERAERAIGSTTLGAPAGRRAGEPRHRAGEGTAT